METRESYRESFNFHFTKIQRTALIEALEPRQLLAADLVATNFNITGGPLLHTGDAQWVSLTVKNKNVIWFLDDAGSFTCRIYISDDPTITTSDTALGDATFSPLGAGQSYTFNFECPRVPAGAPDLDPIRTDNRYWYGVIVDVYNNVAESDETNNANRGDGLDRETVWGEKHLPAPLDGVNVQADSLLGVYTVYTSGIWPKPLYLDLMDGADTGVSATDNITRNNLPTFSFYAHENMQPDLIVDGLPVAFWVNPNPSGYYQITVPALVPIA